MSGKIRILSFLSIAIFIVAISTFLLASRSSVPKVHAATDQTIRDMNNDGIIDLADARIIAPPATVNCPVCVDINGDKKIDQKDVDLIQARIDHNLPYNSRFDVNNDKVINSADVDIVKKYLGQTVTGPAFGLDNPSELAYGFLANDMMIKFKPGTTQQQKDDIYSKYNLNRKIDFAQINSAELHANQSNVENLQKQIEGEPQVAKAGKSGILEPLTDDPNWSDQWAIPKMNLLPAWYLGITGKSSIKVAIVDSGADYTHPDLGNLSTTKRCDATTNCGGILWGAQDLSDPIGHGTHMAGIIGATANNKIAIAGVNWNVEIIPVKACVPDAARLAICPGPYLLLALQWLASQGGIDVVNLSIGADNYTSQDRADIEYYLRDLEYHGTTIVAAAGNDGGNGCFWPASYPGVTCVSATNSNDDFAWCSGGRTDSAISAPGENIMSTVPTYSIVDTGKDGVESFNCGTSMATAYISGMVALCKTIQSTNPPDSRQCGHFNNYDYTTNRRLDAWSYLWYRNCKIFDNTSTSGGPPDGHVDLNDIQSIAFLANTGLYDSRFDVWPAGGDGVIDSRDLYVEFVHYDEQCQ